MAGQAKLTGPDFGAGVDASTVGDGEPVLDHANGEAVLLVRRGDDFLAIGATCTHYGGPLADGLIDGDDVRRGKVPRWPSFIQPPLPGLVHHVRGH